MRNLLAGLVALLLLGFALRMLGTLRFHQRRRQQTRDAELALGRTILVELPSADELVPFSEDTTCFYFGDRSIDKQQIRAVRLLVNGAPIAAAVSTHGPPKTADPTSFQDHPDGIARDRWDVAIESDTDTLLVACGAIRERVSQELARKIFDAVRGAIESRN